MLNSSGLRLLRLDLTHDDREMRERLQNLAHPAAAARREALHDQRLADMRLGDDEIVDVEIVVVLGVGDRRFQARAHVFGDALARKFQVGARARDLLAADQLRDKVELLRRDPQHLAHGLGLVVGEVSFACALAHDYRLSILTDLVRALRRAWPYGPTYGRRKYGSARTRRTCGRPSPRSQSPAHASGRCRRRR